MERLFCVTRLRALIAAAVLVCFANVAVAQQMCPAPYSMVTSPISGRICSSSACAPGNFPAIENGAVTCKPGYATAICPEGDDFMVMTPNGPICQKGYVPVAAPNNSFACNSGDVRVERPPYQLNGALAYETCAPGPSCPAGYIETLDPDNAMGTEKVCMLPCQDFVMNQSMACSCGSGGRLGARQPGASVQQVCQPTCPSGTQWQATSPLFAFQAEEGQCVPDGGGAPVPLAETEPVCPGATYWNGQVCLPVGGGNDGAPVLVFGGCPPGKHWNGSHCAPDFIVLPVCPPGTHWNGLFCVPNAPAPCPIFQKWDGNKCVPIFQQVCPPNQFWNGTKCVPKFQVCPLPKKWVNGQCVLVPQCGPNQVWDGTKCVPKFQFCPPPKKWVNGQCILVPQCGPNQVWDGTKCVPKFQFCPPPKKIVNGQCVLVPQCGPNQVWDGTKCIPKFQFCPPPKKWINGQCI